MTGKNPCYNREPFKDTLKVQEGWDNVFVKTRNPVMIEIKDTGTRDCQYSKTTYDPRCAGCKWNTTNLKE